MGGGIFQVHSNKDESHILKPWIPTFIGFTLIGLGALLCLRPFSLMVQNFYEKLDQGAIATLITAGIGFFALWKQTKSGYKNLINSYDYQYQLSIRSLAANEAKILKNTSAALNSELLYVYNQLDSYIEYVTTLLEQVQNAEIPIDSPIKLSISPAKPEIKHYTYDSCLMNIGYFSSESIHKITIVYTYLLKEETTMEMNAFTKPLLVERLRRNLEKLDEIKIEIEWLRDYFHGLN